MPKSPSPSGCSKRHKVPDSLFQERGRTVLLEQPWAAAGAGAAPAPLSLGQELIEFNHHLPSSLSSPWAGDEPRQADRALLTLVLQGGALPEPYDPVLTGAGINPCGKAVAMMQGDPG